MPWYFKMTSEPFGDDEFGPYDSREKAQAGILRVQESAEELRDGVERLFTPPYSKPKLRKGVDY